MVGDAGVSAVGGDADGALQICPPQSGSFLTVTVHYLRVRMTEHIEASAGDNHVLRPDRPDEIGMTRCAAAMVGSLQDFRLQWGFMFHQIPLGFFGDVSR